MFKESILTIFDSRYGVAEEAIGAIYALAKHPDVLCSNIIRHRAKQLFSGPAPLRSSVDEAGDTPMEDAPIDPEPPSPKPVSPAKATSHASDLSQLLFIVGHVASKYLMPTFKYDGTLTPVL